MIVEILSSFVSSMEFAQLAVGISTGLALLLAGGLSAGVAGGVGGAQIEAGKDAQADLLNSDNFFAVDPRTIESHPIFAQLLQEIQAGLGRNSQAQFSSSPYDVARSEIEALPGVSEKQKRRALVGLRFFQSEGKEHNDSTPRKALRGVLGRTSFASLGELRSAGEQFNADQARFEGVFGPEQIQTILQSRGDNEIGIANLLSDFPSATASDLDTLTEQAREELVSRFTRDAYEQANQAGINPAGLIGEGLRDINTDSISRALQLLGGRQSLAANELGFRLAGKAGGQDPAFAASTLLANSDANAGSVAANQALSRNQQVQTGIGAGQAGLGAGLETISSGAGDISTLLFLNSLQKKPGVSSDLDNLIRSRPDLFGTGAIS